MILGLLLLMNSWTWIGNSLCWAEVQPGVWSPCINQVGEETDPTSGISLPIWDYQGFQWAGSPFCLEEVDNHNFIPSAPEALDVGACKPKTFASIPNNPTDLQIQ